MRVSFNLQSQNSYTKNLNFGRISPSAIRRIDSNIQNKGSGPIEKNCLYAGAMERIATAIDQNKTLIGYNRWGGFKVTYGAAMNPTSFTNYNEAFDYATKIENDKKAVYAKNSDDKRITSAAVRKINDNIKDSKEDPLEKNRLYNYALQRITSAMGQNTISIDCDKQGRFVVCSNNKRRYFTDYNKAFDYADRTESEANLKSYYTGTKSN